MNLSMKFWRLEVSYISSLASLSAFGSLMFSCLTVFSKANDSLSLRICIQLSVSIASVQASLRNPFSHLEYHNTDIDKNYNSRNGVLSRFSKSF